MVCPLAGIHANPGDEEPQQREGDVGDVFLVSPCAKQVSHFVQGDPHYPCQDRRPRRGHEIGVLPSCTGVKPTKNTSTVAGGKPAQSKKVAADVRNANKRQEVLLGCHIRRQTLCDIIRGLAHIVVFALLQNISFIMDNLYTYNLQFFINL